MYVHFENVDNDNKTAKRSADEHSRLEEVGRDAHRKINLSNLFIFRHP